MSRMKEELADLSLAISISINCHDFTSRPRQSIIWPLFWKMTIRIAFLLFTPILVHVKPNNGLVK
jgi:hypothetical protein